MSQLKHFIYTEMAFTSVKIEGIGHLMRHYNPGYSSDRDRNAMSGVGDTLIDLASRVRRLGTLLDCASEHGFLDEEIETTKMGDELDQMERAVEEIFAKKRAKGGQE